MLKVLIIDDSWELSGRDKVYTEAFSSLFEIETLKSDSNVFEQLNNIDVDFYIIDIVLIHFINPEKKEPLEIIDVLMRVPDNKPIFLVSNEYANLVKEKKLTDLMTYILGNHKNVISLIQWSEVLEISSSKTILFKNSLANRIELEMLNYNERKKNTNFMSADIGIVTALEMELTPFLAKFTKESITRERIGNLIVFRGVIQSNNNKKIKFVCAKQDRMGMVDNAFLTSLLITTFNVKHLFHIGVCGGRESEKMNIGDIVIPKESIAYQGGKLSNKGFQSAIESSQSDCLLRQLLDKPYIENILENIVKQFHEENPKEQRCLTLPKPKVAWHEMACGDLIIDKKGALETIADRFGKRKLCSIDMESYSALRAEMLFQDVKVTVIKSVMDKTNRKSDRYKDYASYLAANFLFLLIVDNKIPL